MDLKKIEKLLLSQSLDDRILACSLLASNLDKRQIIEFFKKRGTGGIGCMTVDMLSEKGFGEYSNWGWAYCYYKDFAFYTGTRSNATMLVEHPHPHRNGHRNIEL